MHFTEILIDQNIAIYNTKKRKILKGEKGTSTSAIFYSISHLFLPPLIIYSEIFNEYFLYVSKMQIQNIVTQLTIFRVISRKNFI